MATLLRLVLCTQSRSGGALPRPVFEADFVLAQPTLPGIVAPRFFGTQFN
jgi:hypothetical protein